MAAERRPAGGVAPTGTGGTGLPPVWLSWVVFAVAGSFYLAGFYLRVSPAVMTTELMADFSITASDLGQLSAVFFYAYVLMQIPTGVLVDSWGAKRLLVVGSIVVSVGTFIFGLAPTFGIAAVGRAVVGAGTAVGWVIILKLASHWFPSRRFAMLTGLGLMIGNIGALVAQVPLRLLVEQYHWRPVALGSAVAVLGIGVLAWLFVRNDPVERGYQSYAAEGLQKNDTLSLWQLLKGFKRVFAYKNTWLIFCAQGGFVGGMIAFTGLWGPAFLKARFDLPSTSAAAVCSVMTVCWAVASPIVGHLSDKIGRRKPIYLSGAIIALSGFSTMFFMTSLSLPAFVVIAGLTSFACGSVILGFAFAKESVPVHFLGTISGAINVGNMIGPTILQPAIGRVLDVRWSGQLINGMRVYGVDDYQAGLSLIIGWLTVSCILIAMTKETFCKPQA